VAPACRLALHISTSLSAAFRGKSAAHRVYRSTRSYRRRDAMRPKKKTLSLNRETLRQLSSPELSAVHAAIVVQTARCPTFGCPTWRHSCFDSCYDSDCCLEVP
jgi:hypothetical protein